MLAVEWDSCMHHSEFMDPCFECFWAAEQKVFAQWAARLSHYYGVADMAQDVLGQAVEHLLRRWRQAPPIENPRAYLRRTLERQVCDAARRRGVGLGRIRRQDVSLDATELTVEGGEDPASLAVTGDVSRCLGAALRELTDEQRDVVLCRLVLDLSSKETAHQLGLTPDAVSSTLYRAVRSLRKLLPPTLLDGHIDGGER